MSEAAFFSFFFFSSWMSAVLSRWLIQSHSISVFTCGDICQSYILSVTFINSPRNHFVSIDEFYLGCAIKAVVPTTNQPTSQPTTGASCCLFGVASNRLHRHPESVQKIFLHVQFLFPLFLFPVPSIDLDLEMSDSFYLMWKKNTEINYLIFFLML